MCGFPKLVPFGGPHDKACSIVGSILGSLILGNYDVAFSRGQRAAFFVPWAGSPSLEFRVKDVKGLGLRVRV